MATPVLEKNGKTYGIRVVWTNNAGVKQRKYQGAFATAAKAQKWAQSYIADKQKDNTICTNFKFNEIIDKFLYEKEFIDKLAQSTLANYEENFDTIKADFGEIDIKTVNAIYLQEFINSFINTPRKCKAICQSFSMLYNYMERLDIIDKNIYKKIKVPEYKAKETSFYDDNTFKLLLEKLLQDDECIYTPVLLMGTLGLRPSEVLPLTESDIRNNHLFIDKAIVPVRRKNSIHKQILGGTKTKKSTREFSLSIPFIYEVRAYKEKHKINSSFLCVLPDGAIITESTLQKHLALIIKKYQLPHLTPYGLRHTCGQMQKRLGTDVYTISRIMGHSNIQTTTNTYFHNDNLLNQEAISAITENILKAKVPIESQ